MRRVRGEAPFVVDRKVQPIERLIEGEGELLQFVLGAVDGNPRGQIASDHRRRRFADPRNRCESAAREEPPARGAKRQGRRCRPLRPCRKKPIPRAACRRGPARRGCEHRPPRSPSVPGVPHAWRCRCQRARAPRTRSSIDRSARRRCSRPRSRWLARYWRPGVDTRGE